MIEALGPKRLVILVSLAISCVAVYMHNQSLKQSLSSLQKDMAVLNQSVEKRQNILTAIPDDPEALIESELVFERLRASGASYQNNPQAAIDALNAIRERVGISKLRYNFTPNKLDRGGVKVTQVSLSFEGQDLSVGRRFVSLLRQDFEAPIHLNYYGWDRVEDGAGNNALLYRIEFDWIEVPSFNHIQQ